jgi:hypothetical protein
MVVVFVVLLLVPMLIAVISAVIALIHGEDDMRVGKLVKTLLFVGGLCALIFRPAGKITVDRQAGLLRYTTGWSKKAASEFPLSGLAAVTVEGNAAGSMHRLLLSYRDGSSRPFTEPFSYGSAHHQSVAQALTAALVSAR